MKGGRERERERENEIDRERWGEGGRKVNQITQNRQAYTIFFRYLMMFQPHTNMIVYPALYFLITMSRTELSGISWDGLVYDIHAWLCGARIYRTALSGTWLL